MQTFLPVASFEESAKILDYKRLGKQRVEAMQILKALRGETKGWVNHPATRMWRGYEPALAAYMDTCIAEWIERGFNNTMKLSGVKEYTLPPWFGDEKLHASHRSNLLRKDDVFYSRYGWIETPDLPYVWPV